MYECMNHEVHGYDHLILNKDFTLNRSPGWLYWYHLNCNIVNHKMFPAMFPAIEYTKQI